MDGSNGGVMSNKQSLLIIGAGGHARPVIDTALQLKYHVMGVIDHQYAGQTEKILGISVIGGMDKLHDMDPDSTACIIAAGDGKVRKNLSESVSGMRFDLQTLIHPTAVISNHVHVARGCFVNAGVIINAEVTIGEGTIINTGAIIDHEAQIGAYCHVAPGVRIAGRVKIGDLTFIGIGTSIIDQIQIGECVTVGAGSVIIHDVESHTKIAGVPGKPL